MSEESNLIPKMNNYREILCTKKLCRQYCI